MESHKNMDPSPLCIKGCGFFGSAANNNMCSKCYNDYLKEKILETEAAYIEKSLRILDLQATSDNSSSTISDSSNSTSTNKVVKKRCRSCNKRVGLVAFDCRCGGLFCGTHRYPEEHSCHFDFKKFGRDLLIKQNPIVKADKIYHEF